MSDDSVPWAIAFVVGLASIVVLTGVLGLYRRNGVRHQNRNVYGIALATFFLAIALVMAVRYADVQWTAAFVAQAAFCAFVFSVLTIPLTRASYAKLVVDGVFLRREPSIVKFVLVYCSISVAFSIAGLSDRLLPVIWPCFIGGTFAFLFLTIFSYWHVAQLERELGHPLVEVPAPKPSQT